MLGRCHKAICKASSLLSVLLFEFSLSLLILFRVILDIEIKCINKCPFATDSNTLKAELGIGMIIPVHKSSRCESDFCLS